MKLEKKTKFRWEKEMLMKKIKKEFKKFAEEKNREDTIEKIWKDFKKLNTFRKKWKQM